ncbi:MAG: glycine cleavage system aminomethyltransferase GcvT [Thioalkalivibrionaceae bacterium]
MSDKGPDQSSGEALRKTPLFERHVALGARMVSFAGWAMPLAYASQIEEHHSVRSDAGVFDVSHMRVIDVFGAQARDFLRTALANDVAKLGSGDPAVGGDAGASSNIVGSAQYSLLLAEDGGILDDLIVYRFSSDQYRLVVNAATAERDFETLLSCVVGFDCELEWRDDLALLAVQGPAALVRASSVLPPGLKSIARCKPFQAIAERRPTGSKTRSMLGAMVARTGYTGEDGFEWALSQNDARAAWEALLDVGVKPIGLGARDTLRLEAGMWLYGQDMDETTDPFSVGLGWVVSLHDPERRFIGREGLETRKGAALATMVRGVVYRGRGVLRAGMDVFPGIVDAAAGDESKTIGHLTSGSFSPSLRCSIGLARLEQASVGPETKTLWVRLRGQAVPLELVPPTFVRQGRSRVPGMAIVARVI